MSYGVLLLSAIEAFVILDVLYCCVPISLKYSATYRLKYSEPPSVKKYRGRRLFFLKISLIALRTVTAFLSFNLRQYRYPVIEKKYDYFCSKPCSITFSTYLKIPLLSPIYTHNCCYIVYMLSAV